MLTNGEKAPDFNLPDVEGSTKSLEDFTADLVVVIFTCNHCPYAQAYQQRIVDFQSKYVGKVQVIAINSNDAVNYPEDSFDSMKVRAKEANFNFPYLYDETQNTAKAYGAEVTPDVFVLDSNRILKYRGRIDDSWDDPNAVQTRDLENAVNELLEGKAVTVSEARAIGCSVKWKHD